MTELEVLQALRRHYLPDRGNGDEWAFLPKVRNKAGHDGSRTADLVCVGLWPSRGLPVVGHEVKCSRKDWLTELRNPAKADAFWPVCDSWYLVVSDRVIVHAGELPDTWGLMVVGTTKAGGPGRIKVEVPAPTKPKEERPETLDRSFVAALLKVSARTMDAKPEEIRAAEEAARESERRLQERLREGDQRRIDEYRERERAFEDAAGVSLRGYAGRDAATVGAALKIILGGDSHAENLERRIARLAQEARSIADHADGLAAEREDA